MAMWPMPALDPARPSSPLEDIGRLVVTCDDRPGIVAAVSRFLFEQGANIAQSDQYSTDPEGGRFFLRQVFHLPGLQRINGGLEREFDAQVASRFGMEWRITHAARPKRVAVLVSREDHCLLDLLWRWRRGELPIEIGQVVSNHPDAAEHVARFGVPYEHVPVERGRKAEAEARQLDVLAGRFDLVVLARYMQILSGDFLARLGAPVLNIHHSFLPAFAGAGPYEQAKRRGVKLIGATAHYVTEELDAGPIIEQDVIRVSHREDVHTLRRLGSDIERTVLMRAVQWHCEDRILVHGGTTVVF
jgi:formyltetrahydrofolate deformylase